MLSPSGRVVVNVPSLQWLYSACDRVQGHCRRYSPSGLREVLARNGLRLVSASYWGMPLVPLLVLRRLFHSGGSEAHVMRKGLVPPGRPANRLLGLLARAEMIPQQLVGTSVMMVLERREEINPASHQG